MSTENARLRVLVVDDTVTYRRIISDLLTAMPGVEVVGTAANGRQALQKIEQLRPDLLTLDVEMPELDGLGVLREMRSRRYDTGAIMLSALTTAGADATLAALSLGAFDFVVKPSGASMAENMATLRRDLQVRIEAFARSRRVRQALGRPEAPAGLRPAPAVPRPGNGAGRGGSVSPEVVAIGISTGGPPALTRMLPELPGHLPVPVLIVQHMPPKFTRSLADDLDRRCSLTVSEGQDGQPVTAGQIIIAPGGRQMKVERRGVQVVIRLTDDPPENSCRPAVDYLFRSIAEVYQGRALGVIMTGMGNDGTAGCRVLKSRGAGIIVQDEASCVVYGMPRQPAEEGLADAVVPLERMAAEITRRVSRGALACR